MICFNWHKSIQTCGANDGFRSVVMLHVARRVFQVAFRSHRRRRRPLQSCFVPCPHRPWEVQSAPSRWIHWDWEIETAWPKHRISWKEATRFWGQWPKSLESKLRLDRLVWQLTLGLKGFMTIFITGHWPPLFVGSQVAERSGHSSSSWSPSARPLYSERLPTNRASGRPPIEAAARSLQTSGRLNPESDLENRGSSSSNGSPKCDASDSDHLEMNCVVTSKRRLHIALEPKKVNIRRYESTVEISMLTATYLQIQNLATVTCNDFISKSIDIVLPYQPQAFQNGRFFSVPTCQ